MVFLLRSEAKKARSSGPACSRLAMPITVASGDPISSPPRNSWSCRSVSGFRLGAVVIVLSLFPFGRACGGGFLLSGRRDTTLNIGNHVSDRGQVDQILVRDLEI